LSIVYPPSVTSTDNISVVAKCSNPDIVIDQSKIQLVYEDSARSIIVYDIIQDSTFVAGQDGQLSLEIDGLINPFSN